MSPERRGVPSFLHGSQRFKSKDGRDADTVTKADPATQARKICWHDQHQTCTLSLTRLCERPNREIHVKFLLVFSQASGMSKTRGHAPRPAKQLTSKPLWRAATGGRRGRQVGLVNSTLERMIDAPNVPTASTAFPLKFQGPGVLVFERGGRKIRWTDCQQQREKTTP